MNKKKIVVVVLLVTLIIALKIFTTAIHHNNLKTNISNQTKGNNAYVENIYPNITKYYELSDRIIYLHDMDKILFTYKKQTKDLKTFFNEDEEFLKKFLDELKYLGMYRDGGTHYYEYDDGGTSYLKTSSFSIIACNTIDGNRNIHIGKNLKYEGVVCQLPMPGNS